MKTMAHDELADVDELLSLAQGERLVVTKNGRPVALLTGLKGLDAEEIGYITDPAFWKMIAARRREPTVPFARVKARLVADERRLRRIAKVKVKKGGR